MGTNTIPKGWSITVSNVTCKEYNLTSGEVDLYNRRDISNVMKKHRGAVAILMATDYKDNGLNNPLVIAGVGSISDHDEEGVWITLEDY